jgi:hypothetical protein
MSVTFNKDKAWFDFSSWISKAFLDDCLEIIETNTEFHEFKEGIEDTIKMYIFDIDLTNSNHETKNKFFKLVNKVIELNEYRKGANFKDKDESLFPIYLEKLYLLKRMFQDILAAEK